MTDATDIVARRMRNRRHGVIVLDTNVVSEATRPAPDPRVLRWLNARATGDLYLSGVALAEVLFGVSALPVGARKDKLAHALDSPVPLFPGRVLPVRPGSRAALCGHGCGRAHRRPPAVGRARLGVAALDGRRRYETAASVDWSMTWIMAPPGSR
ncbi:PIN domain-containing protein [Microbacterium sp.]|uniref:PIN domain-containing protein n=1 Tax=Microbacterium sp. TaxID=51671 RepID=UPI003A88FA5A